MSDAFCPVRNARYIGHTHEDCLACVTADATSFRLENDRLRAALLRIVEKLGRVCEDFETCRHVACADSCSAFLIALDALGSSGNGEAP